MKTFIKQAPCASDAISYNIATLTYGTVCGDSETELQSCACSDTERFTSITSSISRDIRVSCGTTATDDQSSASSVLAKYCNQDLTITFSTPTKNVVQAYITDLSQINYLPQCAQSALSEAVMGDVRIDLNPSPYMSHSKKRTRGSIHTRR